MASVAALCVFGVVMVGSASEVVSIDTYGSPWSILLRECLWLVVGVVAFVLRLPARLPAVAAVPAARSWRSPSSCCWPCWRPGSASTSGGSTRWIGFGPLVVQPSEIMKLALALVGADLVARRERAGRQPPHGGGPAAPAHRGRPGGLVLLQPDMGTAVVLGCIALALLFASGVPMGPIVKLLVALAVAWPWWWASPTPTAGSASSRSSTPGPTPRARATRWCSR